MSIFGKSNDLSDHATIISKYTLIKGGINTKGSLFIDGKFEGSIIAERSLTIGENGEVIGNISGVELLTVGGLLDGIITAQNVHILSTGTIIGTLQYENLTIDNNGVFEGQGNKKDSILISKYDDIIKIEQSIEPQIKK